MFAVLGGARVAADDSPDPAAPAADTTSAGSATGVAQDPLPVAPADVQGLIDDYVRSVLRAAVVDVDGHPASCFCAVAVSVSLDGPANAAAVAGRAAGAAPTGPATLTALGPLTGLARSGGSGDATAVSVTGGGSASSSATSGSTGSVSVLGTSGPVLASRTDGSSGDPAPAVRRTTTIRVAQLSGALRTLVSGLGKQMELAAAADTGAQVADLLAGLPAGGSGGEATVEIAAWDGTPDPGGKGTLSCAPAGAAGDEPSCALAIAVTGGSAASATVTPPRGAGGSALDAVLRPGRPGMATAVSVAVSGTAVSGARSGDEGTRPPHGAALDLAGPETGTATGPTTSAARSGRSGSSVAVALTVRGASATSATSGDTGSALSSALGAGTLAAAPGSSVAVPGAGGAGTASATSGDSGDSVSLSSGSTGAAGDSTSGTTGDATAAATQGSAGKDWSTGGGGGGTVAIGGAGGSAAATSSTGKTGPSLSLVISGGSAAATAASGDTGDALATAAGGAGGDTHVVDPGSGVAVRSGDGGAGQVDGTSGGTGTSVAVLVTPYDGSGSSRSGRSGGVTSRSTGGNAGCASSGIDPQLACAPPKPPPVAAADPPLQGSTPSFAGTAAAGAEAGPKAAAPRAGTGAARTTGNGRTRTDKVARADARSADSADVTCSATARARRCSSPDTAPVRVSVPPPARRHVPAPSGDPVVPGGAYLGLDAAPAPAAGTGAVLAASTELARLTSTSGRPAAAGDSTGNGLGTIGLLVNAAVPLLAVLSLIAMFAVSRRKRNPRPPAYLPKHRRKQDLPHATRTR